MIRSYTGLQKLHTFEDRYAYLLLRGDVGRSTFGFDRYINQQFYTSSQWKHIRHQVIARDQGCDLGVEGFEIFDRIVIHHMNPMTPDEIIHADDRILDPEFLVTTTHRTHNAIHFGDAQFHPRVLMERKRGDTRLW